MQSAPAASLVLVALLGLRGSSLPQSLFIPSSPRDRLLRVTWCCAALFTTNTNGTADAYGSIESASRTVYDAA